MNGIRESLIDALNEWENGEDILIDLTDGERLVLDGVYKTLENNERALLEDVDHWEFGPDYIALIEPCGFPDLIVRIFFDTISKVTVTKME